MKIPVAVSADIFSLLALFFTIYLTKKNMLINNIKTQYYLKSSCLVCIILILEIIDATFANGDYRFRIPRIIANTIGFTISPIVPLYISFLHNEKLMRFKRYLFIPFYIIAILSLTSWKTGWLFNLSSNNEYSRGPLFLIYPICMLLYLILIIYSDFENHKNYEKDEIRFLYSLYMVIFIGTILQLIFPNWLLIWGSIGVSLLLYYIFLRELQFKHDPMTEIYNRSVFQNELSHLKSIPKVGIVVIDINDLKLANDKYGHAVGDEMIIKVANSINDCFASQGRSYRIGGDEFCIICKGSSEEMIMNQLNKLDLKIKSVSENFLIKITIACGYCIFDPEKMKDIYEAFTIADQRMYTNKTLAKSKNEKIMNKMYRK